MAVVRSHVVDVQAVDGYVSFPGYVLTPGAAHELIEALKAAAAIADAQTKVRGGRVLSLRVLREVLRAA